jgi:hypothetical protein
MRRIGDNEVITISWRKFRRDFKRKVDEKVQDDRHPITSSGESITILGHFRKRESKILIAFGRGDQTGFSKVNETQRNCELYQIP